MQLPELEVVSSLSIRTKIPWSCFSWLNEGGGGRDISSGLFLLDNTRISKLSLDSGKTKRSFPSLSGVQLALTCASHSGNVLAGLTVHGHMFTCLQPSHQLATYTTPLSLPSPHPETLRGCHLFVSDSVQQALLVTSKLDLHLWQMRDGQQSNWWMLPVPDDISLPHTVSRQAAIDTSFYVHQALGECCEIVIVHTNHDTAEIGIAHCLLTRKIPHADANIQEHSKGKPSTDSKPTDRPLEDITNVDSAGSTKPASSNIPVHVKWKTCTVSKSSSLSHAPCGRGCFVVKMSPTGRVSAVAVNHDNAADTYVLFTDLSNEVSVSSQVYFNSNDVMTGRTFWITSLAWSGDGLLLAAMTRRGCLVLLPRFGPPLKLVTTGCDMDMGPTEFLPLHPLITVENRSGLNITDHETSESSERDELRQRFTVVTHPYLPAILCSDGYCVTLLKLSSTACTLPSLVYNLVTTGSILLGHSSLPSYKIQSFDGADSGIVQTKGDLKSFTEECVKRNSSMGNGTLPMGGSFLTRDEGGKVCTNGLPRTLNPSGCEKEPLAKAHLVAGWGLLLSCSNFQPGNGIYPHILSANEVKCLSSEMEIAKNVAITVLATQSLTDRNGSILSTLSLAYLDQIDQRCRNIVYKLASMYLLSLLSRLLQEHQVFASSTAHTNLSVQTYTKSVTSGLRHFWRMFQRIVMLVTDVYNSSVSESQKVFSLPLLVLMKICIILSKDMHTCCKLADTMCLSDPESLGLQSREGSFLQGSIAGYINKTSANLDSIKSTLTMYFSYGMNTMVALTCWNTVKCADSHAKLDHIAEDNGLLNLPRLLETCQLRQALELVYSLIGQQSSDRVNIVSPCTMSVPGTNLVPTTVLAGIIQTHPCLNIMIQLLATYMEAFFCSKTGTVHCIIPSTVSKLLQSRDYIEVTSNRVACSVQEQGLASNWTPTHAVELYLLNCQWHKAAKLAVMMGDWKKGLMLSIVQIIIHRSRSPARTNNVHDVEQFAHRLALERILRALVVSRKMLVQKPAEQPLVDSPYVCSILRVCSYGSLNCVGPDVSFILLRKIWKVVKSLPVQVPGEYRLPAPPLYRRHLQAKEYAVQGSEESTIRQTLSHLICCNLTILLACSSHLFCQWYINALTVLHRDVEEPAMLRHMPNADGLITKIQVPSTLKRVADEGCVALPELSYSEQCQLAAFREMCGLLWLLHVRDNTTHYLQQVLHFKHCDKPADSHTMAECALWCARLLPLQGCLSCKDTSEIENMLLSSIMELPCNQLMATLLAQNFPDNQGIRSSKVKLMMDQLLREMRKTVMDKCGHQGTSRPLSVEYQIMSRTVLEDQCSGVCEYFSPHCLRSDDAVRKHALTLKDNALGVGSYLFEYDQAYIDFLDQLFSTVLTGCHVPSSQPISPSLIQTLPCTTPVNTSVLHVTSPNENQFSERIQPLVTSLYEWTQTTDTETSLCNHRRKQRTGTPAMKIDISLSFLAYCVQLEDEKYLQSDSEEEKARFSSLEQVTVCSSLGPDTNCSEDTITAVTPVPSSTTTTVTPDMDSATLSDSTLHAEDLDNPSPVKHPAEIRNFSVFNPSSLRLGQHPFPLLQIPDGMYTVHAEHDESPQSLPSSSALSVSLSPTSGGGMTTSATLCTSQDGSSVQLTSGLDLADSQSTGELPSQLSFSDGELGSAHIPNSTAPLFQSTLPSSPLDSSQLHCHGNNEYLPPSEGHAPLSTGHTSPDVEDPPPSIDNPRPIVNLDHSQLHTCMKSPPNVESPLSSTEESSDQTEPQLCIEQPPSNDNLPPSSKPNLAANVGVPPSNIEQPLPSPCPSNVELLPSNIEQPLSNIEQPLSNIEQPLSNVEQPLSNVEQPPSNVKHPRTTVASKVDQWPPSSVEQPVLITENLPPKVDELSPTHSSIVAVVTGNDTTPAVEESQLIIGREEVDGAENEGLLGGNSENQVVGGSGRRSGDDDSCGVRGNGDDVGRRVDESGGEVTIGGGDGAHRDNVLDKGDERVDICNELSVSAPASQSSKRPIVQRKEDISRIVRSEMKKFLQVQHHQLMKILNANRSSDHPQDITTSTSPSNSSHSEVTPSPVRHHHLQLDSCTEPEETGRQSSSTSHLSVRHLHLNSEPTSPPPLLAPPLLSGPTTTQPLVQQTRHKSEAKSHRSSPTLLQLSAHDGQPSGEMGVIHRLQLPPTPRSPEPTQGDIPLLTLGHTGADGMFPLLPQVPSQLPTTMAHTEFTLPLLHLHCPDPPPVHLMENTPPPITTHNTQYLPSVAAVTVMSPQSTPCAPLPLLVPENDNDNVTSLPSLGHAAIPAQQQPVKLPPADIHTCNSTLELLHIDDQPCGEFQPFNGHTIMPNLNKQSTDQRHGDIQPEDQPHLFLMDMKHASLHRVDDRYGQNSAEGNRIKWSQHTEKGVHTTQENPAPSSSGPSPTHAITEYHKHHDRTHPQHGSQHALTAASEPATQVIHIPSYCEKELHAPLLPNDHKEGVPDLEDPNATPSQMFPSTESEGVPVDQPSGQTPDSSTKTVTTPVSVEPSGRGVTDISTDEGSIPNDGGSSVVCNEVEVGTRLGEVEAVERGGGGAFEDKRAEDSAHPTQDRTQRVPGQVIETQLTVDHSETKPTETQPTGHSETQPTGHSGTLPTGHSETQPTGHSGIQPTGHSGTQPTGHSAESEDDAKRGGAVASRNALSQLHHLERQLTAIENTARTVESELLASNQLLGTIDELQAVPKATPTLQSHQKPSEPHAEAGGVNTVAAQSAPVTAIHPATRDGDSHTQSVPPHVTPATTPLHHSPSPPFLPPSLPPHPRAPHHLPVDTPHTPRPMPQSVTDSRANHSEALSVGRHHVHSDHNRQRLHYYTSLLPSGRYSKQTLKRWVAAKRREKASTTDTCTQSSAPLQIATEHRASRGHRRSQSQDHMSRRMEGALTLMEDILSAKPSNTIPRHTTPSTSLHKRPTGHYTRRKNSGGIIDNPATQQGPSCQTEMRYCSSVEGLTTQEQQKMEHIMASTELSSVSSGSVASHIDWELVDHLIDH